MRSGKRRTESMASSPENSPSASNRDEGSGASEPLSSMSHGVSVIKTVPHASPSVSVEPFTFKTPSPVRTARSNSALKPSVSVSVVKSNHSKKSESTSVLSSKPQCVKSEIILDGRKASLVKKKAAVKIASFAKTPEADHSLAGSGSSDFSRRNLELISSSLQSFTEQRTSSGVSKQPITQTSLPTPDLNAALRSFFNNTSNPDPSSPEQTGGQSDSEEEEEILVYMQFDSKLDSDLLQPHTPFKIIGVDSEKPVLQLGNQVFEGNWCDTVGTAVFFEEHVSASPGDPVFMKNSPSTLKYHSKTQKGLVMSRIFIKPKDENDDIEEDMDLPSNSASGPMVPIATIEVAP